MLPHPQLALEKGISWEDGLLLVFNITGRDYYMT